MQIIYFNISIRKKYKTIIFLICIDFLNIMWLQLQQVE